MRTKPHPRPRKHVQQRLVECATMEGAQVDAAAGVVRGVKIIGRVSKNGREYTREALQNAAPLYEGVKVNVNHRPDAKSSRAYQDRFGVLQAVESRADGLYGDLHYNPKHPLAEQFAWDAQHAPRNVGLSHDAFGRSVRRDGKVIIEEIKAVNSVDIVADPATTSGLFEHLEPEETMSLKEITLEQLREERPDLLQALEATEAERKAALALQEENKALKAQLAEIAARQKLAERKERIAAQLKEAGLDIGNAAHCSPVFLESLEIDDEAKRKALIEDRKALVAALPANNPTPKGETPRSGWREEAKPTEQPSAQRWLEAARRA